jgi:hypothetical protein
MTVDREELKKRYAAMSDAELGLINREELGYLARECYDGEVCRRDVERPATVPFVGVAGGSAVEPPSRGTRYLLLGVIWAFVLLVGAEYFAFEHVANWLGILCWWIGGGILSFKLARDQERNAGFWLVLTLFLGPIAALVLLALSPELGRVWRVLVVVVPFIVSAIVVQGLCALTGQGAYRVVKAADVAIGGGAQENLCDQVVNVEGEITEVGSQVPIFLDVDPGQQARAFALVDESSKLPNGSSLAVDVIGNKRYPLPRIGERLRVGGLVRCVTSIGPGKFGTLLEVSRRPLQ